MITSWSSVLAGSGGDLLARVDGYQPTLLLQIWDNDLTGHWTGQIVQLVEPIIVYVITILPMLFFFLIFFSFWYLVFFRLLRRFARL